MGNTGAGIAGYWGRADPQLLEVMAGVPQPIPGWDRGAFTSAKLAFTGPRYAIAAGESAIRLPVSEDGNVAVAFDGELYNRDELRSELIERGVALRSTSDGELLLRAFMEYGVDCFTRFNGIWAVGIADLRGGGDRLLLGRDHLGVKPLYLAESDGRVLFSSQIKPILQDPAFGAAPNDKRIDQYLYDRSRSEPVDTFFAGIRHLPPAHYAIIDSAGAVERAYWRPQRSTGLGGRDPSSFRMVLRKSVERRLPKRSPEGPSFGADGHSGAVAKAMRAALSGHVTGLTRTDTAESVRILPVPTPASSLEFMDDLPKVLWHHEQPLPSVDAYLQWRFMTSLSPDVDLLIDCLGSEQILSGSHRGAAAQNRLRTLRTWYRKMWGKNFPIPGESAGRAEDVTDGVGPSGPDLASDLLGEWAHSTLQLQLESQAKNAAACLVTCRSPFLDLELVEWVLGQAAGWQFNDGDCQRIGRPQGAKRSADPRVVDLASLQSSWVRARRAHLHGVFGSAAFHGRKYWHGSAVTEAFTAGCAHNRPLSSFFWRALNVELWLRIFVDRPQEQMHQVPARGELEAIGDLPCRRSLSVGATRPHKGRHLAIAGKDGGYYLRLPVRTRIVSPGDQLPDVLHEGLSDAKVLFRPGDVVVIAEKIVAVSQGRCVALDQVDVGLAARVLSRFVTKTSAGISLRLPASFQLAIEDVGLPTILAATAAAALTRPVGVRGAFYYVAGWKVAAIDSPDADALPPSDTHIKLAPIEPEQTAQRLARYLSETAHTLVEVAVVDANDIGAEVLGASGGVDRLLVASLLRDNPLGQDTQQTPIGIIRRVNNELAHATRSSNQG